jgi:3-deoxy-manno-octulosonate cytidylyltransferase (CMP-KDO synthetase)
MSYTVVIPSRYGSSRLPGKPLLSIGDKPMVQHVWERASRSAADRVIIATDDERIEQAARGFGAEVMLTRADHVSGTDRLQEVAATLELADDHIVVNVQGDEPLIPPAVIDQVAANLAANPGAGIATLCEPIEDRADLENPNVVKVVADAQGRALYFSRAPIPWPRDAFAGQGAPLPAGDHWFRHIGIYAYRSGFLHQFVNWPPAPQESLEQLEQLRAQYNGVEIHVAPCCEAVPAGVDTQADLDAVRAQVAK